MGEKLAAIRRRHGLSLDLMARYLDVNPGSLSCWERGGPVLFKHHLESFLEDYEKGGRQANALAAIWASSGAGPTSYSPASRLPEPRTFGDHLYKRRLELGLAQSTMGKRIHAGRAAIWHWETDRFLPDHKAMPRVIRFLGILPVPNTPAARLLLFRRALGLTAMEFEHRFHISRYKLCLWETGQAEIDNRSWKRS